MIYLASPYSHPDFEVREARFRRACEVAGRLMAQGEIIYSPIAHTHPISLVCKLPGDWKFWERYDREMIKVADKLYVLRMEGWQESIGVPAEIAIATDYGIPIQYLEDK